MNGVTMAATLVLKPVLIVAAAALIVLVIRRRGAAARHAMWTGAVVALFALPVLSALLPPLHVPVMPDVVPPILTGATSRIDAPTSAGTTPPAAGTSRERSVERASLRFVPDTLFTIWAIVALVLVARRIAAEWKARRLVERGAPPTARIAGRAADVASLRGERAPRVVLSEDTPSPAVAGVVWPAVLLPGVADGWDDAQIDAVMQHELSHVRRRDCLVNLIADLAAAVYWCNPLVWLAARRVRAEAELACDEDALRAGSDPDGYAAMLLDFARSALATRTLPRAVTAAARPSELESRVLAVLGLRRPTAPLRGWMTVAFMGMVPVVALPIAAATMLAAPAVATQDHMETHTIGDAASERVPLSVDRRVITAAARRALAGPDSVLAAKLVAALDHTPQHANDLIRDRAMWALSLTRGNRLLEPVVEALDHADWRVQSYAAWTVAVARDHGAVPRLIALLEHPVWRVRAHAAFALCEIEAPEAVDAMIARLDDPAWQVRLEAVEYLAAIGDPKAQRDRLRARLNDEHIAVRRAVERVLSDR